MSIYPGAIPTNTNYPNRTDDADWLYAARYNEIKNEVIAICAELGINPKGASATVVARLALLALKASPTFTGQAIIPTINLTGGQIAFPATALPSADPNTIDDYEEGTWTPDLQFGDAKVGITYNYQAGNYVKAGKGVILTTNINLSSKGTSVGSAHIKALPFTVLNATGAYSVPTLHLTLITFANQFQGYCATNDTKVILQEVTEAGDCTDLTNANFPNVCTIKMNLSYISE